MPRLPLSLSAPVPDAPTPHRREQHLREWKALAPAGLALVALGVNVVADAAGRKTAGKHWFWPGMAGLVSMNAGLSLFGEAVKKRALADWIEISGADLASTFVAEGDGDAPFDAGAR